MSDTTKERLSDKDVKELIKKSQAGDQEARDFLVEKNTRLVWSVVQRYLRRGYDQDDLYQIGCIGLLKSIDKFDLSYDVRFSTYAVPMIIGEIQRFIRDDGSVKVSRSLKELNHKVRAKKEELLKEYGRSPTVNELADALGLTREEIVQAEEVGRTPQSIYETVYENEGDPITLVDQIAEEESNWFDHLTLQDVMSKLDKRERLIIYLRYYKDQTQTEVAERLGISQVQVSRLEKKILADMKETMNDTS
ncbi:RNA polymerase sporulation sigma factor SigF [Halobacillus litoralis]|uniref:RNA polymerase sporulation sigma factor SigF n=2 Tax=Halobacillus TaxID=45667 RepID=A0A845E2B3_9BACI|nr:MULTISPECIES: RNA polymerase sporulation sigma factor SigF [Halobacillus]MBX0356153.1 RNA polymerase sporulation sigma factor SigF [Halobacillus sp. Nhm2S1]MYL48399.1 RNA polymerase sporulation sigma factor SigF [Halobacillus litoralis]WLR46684.1 RNA polymerase sporulation sigma factor SigF [Halobacillus litoralis]GEN54846.1 RNA polymerase sigma factor [Halobacillus faecis]